jgi:hypothetical protein
MALIFLCPARHELAPFTLHNGELSHRARQCSGTVKAHL